MEAGAKVIRSHHPTWLDRSTPMLSVRGLAKRYGSDGSDVTEAIADVSFEVSEGEFVCVVGPSGCGKTTFLKCVAGLLAPTSGSITLLGGHVSGPPEGLGLVFQDYSRSLMPWLTVLGNVTLPLRSMKLDRRARRERALAALDDVGLQLSAHRYPWQLSGGMQQRVAIARALAAQPRLLLMDEPFASVDAQTRAELEDLTLRLHAEHKMTVLLVTHDIDEAVYMADRVVVFSDRPTRVNEIVPVSLPRPRDQVETKELEEFVRLRGHVFREVTHRQSSVSVVLEHSTGG